MMYSFSQECQDPAEEVEQADTNTHHLHMTMDAIETLPQRQQRAMLCSLNEKIDDVHAFTRECRARNIDTETLYKPVGGEELQAMRSSTTIARKKLRLLLKRRILAS